MAAFIQVLKVFAILAAAGMLGNWFLMEVNACKRRGAPWIAPYLTPPGLIIVGIVIFGPILLWWLNS